jgi:hypothetical protein
MKKLFFLMPLIAGLTITCSVSKRNTRSTKKLEIVAIDYTRDHFVFKTKDETGTEIIVLAEKDSVEFCQPFKKFIILDSIHETSVLKSGSRKDIVGFYLSYIDGIKIRNKGELVKIIWNCNCFTN